MRRIVVGAMLVVVAAAPMAGQVRPVAWTAAPVAAHVVSPGASVQVRLTAVIDHGWHIYSITQGPGGPIPMRVALATGQPFGLADAVHGPRPTKRFDPNFGIDVETYDDTATFTLVVRVASDAAAGSDTLAIKARYQACSATLCLPPRTETVLTALTVARASRSATRAAAAATVAG
jgi:DsbC/DsbD-like thiol-disulfide interchange protein